jgi:hypothetical protein
MPDAIFYEGSITAAVVNGYPGTHNLVEGTALPISVADSGSGGGSRIPNSTETGNAASDWSFSNPPTPGAPN